MDGIVTRTGRRGWAVGEVVRVTSRERQWGGRAVDEWPRLLLFLCRQDWMGGSSSLSTSQCSEQAHRGSRLLHAAAAAAFVVRGTLPRISSHRDIVWVFFYPPLLFLFLAHGFREDGRLKTRERTNVPTTRGQRAASARGLGRTAGNVMSERGFPAELL